MLSILGRLLDVVDLIILVKLIQANQRYSCLCLRVYDEDLGFRLVAGEDERRVLMQKLYIPT